MNESKLEPKIPLVSVIVPFFNEEKTLAEIIHRIVNRNPDTNFEIILVDDGSEDRSRQVAQECIQRYVDTEIRLIANQENSGKGAAVRQGIFDSTGDVVLIQDADLEYDPADYAAMIEPIESGVAKVTFGSRFLTRQKFTFHRLANRCLTWLSNRFTGLNLTDMETCLKAFDGNVAREIGQDLEQPRFGVEPELAARVARLGCKVVEVPVSYQPRSYTEGKKISLLDGVSAIWHIVRYGLFA